VQAVSPRDRGVERFFQKVADRRVICGAVANVEDAFDHSSTGSRLFVSEDPVFRHTAVPIIFVRRR
jgi:hypothetical protein